MNVHKSVKRNILFYVNEFIFCNNILDLGKVKLFFFLLKLVYFYISHSYIASHKIKIKLRVKIKYAFNLSYQSSLVT